MTQVAGKVTTSVKIDYIIVKSAVDTAGERAVDISNLFDVCNIYHSIDDFHISGDITVSESIGLLDAIPMVGMEYIQIRFSSLGQDVDSTQVYEPYEGLFVIYAVEELNEADTKMRKYVLKFADPTAVINMDKRLSIRYKGKAENVLKTILTKQLGYPEDALNFQPTKYEYDFLVPGWRPFQFMTYLCETAINEKTGLPDCVFFVDTDGKAYFSALGELLSPEKESKYNFTKAVAQADLEKIYLYNASRVQFPTVFNTFEQKTDGVHGVEMDKVDIQNKKVEVVKYEYVDLFDKDLKPSGPGRLFSISKETNSCRIRRWVGLAPYTEHVDEYGLKGQAVRSHRRAFTIMLEMNGISDLRLAEQVDFDFPNISVKDSSAASDPIDPYFGKKWLITKIRHSFTMTKHSTFVELVKDSYASERQNLSTLLNVRENDIPDFSTTGDDSTVVAPSTSGGLRGAVDSAANFFKSLGRIGG